MAQRLTGMSIDKVALVDRGANGRTFAVLKREKPMDDTDAGILASIRKLLGFPRGNSAVAKTQTFASIVAGQELSDALDETFWTLQSALWSAVYAVDDQGADLSLEAKQALVGQNLDEFKAYLLAEMAEGASIGKRDVSPERRALDGFVAKVGRKISGSRLERLQAASSQLTSVLAEVEEETDTEKRQEGDMTPEELTAAISKAVEPLATRIEALEKRAPVTVNNTTVEKTGSDDDEVTLEGIAEAVSKIADRLDSIEKARGTRTSAGGADDQVRKRESKWAGMF